MSEVLADLSLRLRADTAEFNQKVTKAGQSVNKFGTKSKKDLRAAQQATKENLGKITSGFGEMASGVTGQIDRMTGGLGSLVSGAAGSLKGIMGLSKGLKVFKLALISTGLGAIIPLLGSLVVYLTQTQAGMDIVSKATAAVGAVFDALLERVGFVGEAIVKLFKGDFEGAADSAKKAYEGLGDQIAKNYDDAIDRSNEEVNLREEKIKWITKEAELEAKKAKLMLKSRQEEEYSAAERVKFIKEAAALQKQVTQQNIAFKEREVDIQRRINEQGITTAEDRETLANLQKEAIKLREDESNKLRALVRIEKTALGQAKAKAEEQELLNAKLERTKAIMTDIAGSDQGAGIEMPEIKPIQVKIAPVDTGPLMTPMQKAMMQLQDFFEGIGTEMNQAFENAGAAMNSIGGLMGASLNKRTIQMENHYKKEREAIESSAMSEEAKARAIESLDNKVAAEKKKHAAQQAKMDKASALLGAIVNTAQGVTKAIAQGGIAGPVLGAVVAAFGAAQIATIASTPIPAFANGGIAPGGVAMVGERGPELVNLAKGSRVHSNEDTKRMLGGSQNIQVNIRGVIEGDKIRLVLDESDRRAGINF